jgi:hypothetical protein
MFICAAPTADHTANAYQNRHPPDLADRAAFSNENQDQRRMMAAP